MANGNFNLEFNMFVAIKIKINTKFILKIKYKSATGERNGAKLIRFSFHPCRLPRTDRSIPLRRTRQLTLCDRYGQTFPEANRRSRCDAADHGQGCGRLSGVREETGEPRQDRVRVESVRHKLYITRWLDSQSSGCDAAARHLGGKQLLSVHGQCPTATVFLAQRVQGGSQHGDGWTVRTLRLRVRIHKWLFPHTKRYRIALKEIANVGHTKKNNHLFN